MEVYICRPNPFRNGPALFLLVIIDSQIISQFQSCASCKKGYLDTVRQLKCWSGEIRTLPNIQIENWT